MDLTGFEPKYNTFDCYDILTNFQMGEAVGSLVDQRASGAHVRRPR